MTTEARKAYEKQMPRWEMVLRSRIKFEKSCLKTYKEELIENTYRLRRYSAPKEIRLAQEVVQDNISFLKKAIAAQKRVIQVLKNGLPQRRPKGVMAKCPHCGAKRNWLRASGDEEYGFEAYCLRCGASSGADAFKCTQDAIDAWNRRAR